jgi:putative oxidoreductase
VGDMNGIYTIAFLIGRIFVGGFFIIAGINHFANHGMMTGYAKMKGTPAPAAAVAGSGLLLLLGGLSLLLGFHPTIGVILLAIFLIPTSFLIHNFWAVQDPQAKMNDMVNFEKNIALLGFLLMTLLIARPWPMSLGGR